MRQQFLDAAVALRGQLVQHITQVGPGGVAEQSTARAASTAAHSALLQKTKLNAGAGLMLRISV